MSKRRQRKKLSQPSPGGVQAFTFGEPTPVLNKYDFLYTGCWMVNARYYEPPVDLSGLAKIYRATAHHGSALQVKRNILLKTFQPTRWLNHTAFTTLALDYLVFGNCYGQQLRSRLGTLMEVKPALARYTRVGTEPDSYWWVHNRDQKPSSSRAPLRTLRSPI